MPHLVSEFDLEVDEQIKSRLKFKISLPSGYILGSSDGKLLCGSYCNVPLICRFYINL